MRLPKKITPDNIIDAAVEVRYLSNLPFEVLIGLFFEVFDDSYKYTTRLPTPNSASLSAPQGFFLNIGNQSLIYNDKISMKLSPNSFGFGIVSGGKYIGWESYESEIKKALTLVSSTGHILKWNRVGIRYITEYLSKDLRNVTKFNFEFGLAEIQSLSTAFRSEFEYDQTKIILNMMNKQPTIKQRGDTAEIVPTSTIDVDTIKEPLDISEITELLELINKTHKTGKEVFFRLLTDDFLKTLNPEY